MLGEHFPFFQINAATIDQRGIKRLHEALNLGKAKINAFSCIALKHMHTSVSDDELALLLRKMFSREGGLGVAIENLGTRFYLDERSDYSVNLLAVAREVVLAHFSNEEENRRNNDDFGLAVVARACLNGQEGIRCAMRICQYISDGMRDYRINSFTYPELLGALAQRQTEVFLDVFLLDEQGAENYLHLGMFSGYSGSLSNPLDGIADEALISWCETDPYKRYPLLASAIAPFRKSNATGKYEWKPLVFTILEKSPDLNTVLKNLEDAINPSVWSGSLGDILQERSSLFLEFQKHNNPEVRDWAERQLLFLHKEIERERSYEEHRRQQDEGFE